MNNLLLEIQEDMLGIPLERPECTKTTALGAAYLAGPGVGIYDSLENIKSRIKTEKRVLPTKDTAWINKHVDLWRKAVTRSLSWK